MRFLTGTALTALAVLTLASPVNAQNARNDRSASQNALVEVQNNFNQPVTVFMERGQFDRRLGTVAAMTTDSIPLPAWLTDGLEEIALFVVPKKGEEMATQIFPVHRGEVIGLIVPTPPPAREVIYEKLPADEVSKTTLTVDNREDRDVVVYADEGQFQLRLGTAAAGSTTTLEFPASVVRPDHTITIEVQPKGALDMESYPLRVRPGEHLGLRLEPNEKAHEAG